jgi:hypothetical protein
VLTAESPPHLDTYTRTYTVEAFVQKSTMWCWEQLRALPQYAGDVHGAATSSKLGMTFTGVLVDTLLSAAKPLADATHVLACCHDEAEPVSSGGSIETVMVDALCCRRHRAAALGCASRPTARSSRDLRSAVRRFFSAEVRPVTPRNLGWESWAARLSDRELSAQLRLPASWRSERGTARLRTEFRRRVERRDRRDLDWQGLANVDRVVLGGGP